MIEMTFELAEKIAKAAHKKSKELNRPMSVSIVDESGRMVYFSRADGAGFYTFDTSKAKAMAAEIAANEARVEASNKTNADSDSEDQVPTDKIEKSEEE